MSMTRTQTASASGGTASLIIGRRDARSRRRCMQRIEARDRRRRTQDTAARCASSSRAALPMGQLVLRRDAARTRARSVQPPADLGHRAELRRAHLSAAGGPRRGNRCRPGHSPQGRRRSMAGDLPRRWKSAFRERRFSDGAVDGIDAINALLAHHFPRAERGRRTSCRTSRSCFSALTLRRRRACGLGVFAGDEVQQIARREVDAVAPHHQRHGAGDEQAEQHDHRRWSTSRRRPAARRTTASPARRCSR